MTFRAVFGSGEPTRFGLVPALNLFSLFLRTRISTLFTYMKTLPRAGSWKGTAFVLPEGEWFKN